MLTPPSGTGFSTLDDGQTGWGKLHPTLSNPSVVFTYSHPPVVDEDQMASDFVRICTCVFLISLLTLSV